MLMSLFRAIVRGEDELATSLLTKSARLASEAIRVGASRANSSPHYLQNVNHYVYAGDTALHIAAAAYRADIAQRLVARGARVRARNRRGAEALHYAADGMPDSAYWNPSAQVRTIVVLIGAGADPDASDAGGATPLHRAVRTCCAAAVRALLEGGADPGQKNRNGSTPLDLARRNTGRGGSGSIAARAEQAQILDLLGALQAT